jgi:hypothetical protein
MKKNSKIDFVYMGIKMEYFALNIAGFSGLSGSSKWGAPDSMDDGGG